MQVSFPWLIERNARHSPDQLAILCDGRQTTWADLARRCQALAGGLAHLGVSKGGRVAFLGLNSDWFYECYFTPSFLGAEAVALNYRLAPAELQICLEDSAAEVLIVDSAFADQARAFVQDLAKPPQLIVIGCPAQAGEHDYEALIAAGHRCPDAASSGDDTLIIYYSGGTTGRPKGIMLSHTNMLANATGHTLAYKVDGDDTHLLIGPMFHLAAGARVFCAVYMGLTLVIMPKFTPRGFLQLIEAHQVNATMFIPAMMQMVLDLPDFDEFDLSSLRQMSFGASAALEELLHRIIAAFPHVDISHGYGMTEAAPLISYLGPEYHRADFAEKGKLGAVGWPPRHVDIRVVDEDGQDVPQGIVGEVILRGPNVMKGYLNQPELTAETLRGGWLHSGDAGYFDADGCLWLSGRIKDMIISGGENVYPGEVENVLSLHPAVADVAVIGVPHPKWGEAVHAIVVPIAGAAENTADLIAFCRQKIAAYKCPVDVTWRSSPLPLSGANKVLKTELRKPFWEGATEPKRANEEGAKKEEQTR